MNDSVLTFFVISSLLRTWTSFGRYPMYGRTYWYICRVAVTITFLDEDDQGYQL